MHKIAIVTDSTCDADNAELAGFGAFCVNLKAVNPEDGSVLASSNEAPEVERFMDYIQDCEELPTTTQPSPTDFGDLYSELAQQGYTGILSVHITEEMSGTASCARMAAQSSPIPVRVVDSHRLTWPLALMVRYLTRLRDNGADLNELEQAVEDVYTKTSIVFALDTVRNLVKGGRAGKATGVAASLLDIKPLLTVDNDGQVSSVGIAKSMKRAVKKLAAKGKALADEFGPLEGYFIHARNPEAVNALRKAFEELQIPFKELGERQIGPVVTTHVGVGCVGFAYIPVEC